MYERRLFYSMNRPFDDLLLYLAQNQPLENCLFTFNVCLFFVVFFVLFFFFMTTYIIIILQFIITFSSDFPREPLTFLHKYVFAFRPTHHLCRHIIIIIQRRYIVQTLYNKAISQKSHVHRIRIIIIHRRVS